MLDLEGHSLNFSSLHLSPPMVLHGSMATVMLILFLFLNFASRLPIPSLFLPCSYQVIFSRGLM